MISRSSTWATTTTIRPRGWALPVSRCPCGDRDAWAMSPTLPSQVSGDGEKERPFWVLLADIGPEQSLNRNSKFVQTLFRVCSYSVHIHTLFRVCAEFVTLCSYFSQPLFDCAQYVQRLFKKTSQPQRPKRLRSAYVRSLFQLKVAFKFCSDIVHIQTLFNLCSQIFQI